MDVLFFMKKSVIIKAVIFDFESLLYGNDTVGGGEGRSMRFMV